MSRKFKIELFHKEESERLPIHFNTLEYFEKFVEDKILNELKIIVNSKWTHSFGIFFDSIDYKNIPEWIKGFDGIEKNLAILPPSTFSQQYTKAYSVQFFINKIKDHPSGEFIGFCEMLLDFIEVFFTLNYKKVKSDYITEIRSEVNWDFIKSIPYPAELCDQKYVE